MSTVKSFLCFLLFHVAAADNYCGTSFSDSSKCASPCPRGLDGECPNNEKCFAGVTCSISTSPTNYCGTSSSNAFKCQVPCPIGLDSECPSGEKCFSGVTCPINPTPKNYCGTGSNNANKCEVPCPDGLDGECPSGEQCYADIICSTGNPVSPTPSAGGFANDIVKTANNEYAAYGKRHECFDTTMKNRIGDYWSALSRSLNGCNRDVPWSAAFISYMVLQSGGGDEFLYSSAHRFYIHDAFAGGRRLYNSVANIDTSNVKAGDLACSGRSRISGWGYSDFLNWYSNGGTNYDAIPTHCDIIVGVIGQQITVIGGNVNQRVTRETTDKGTYAIVLRVTS